MKKWISPALCLAVCMGLLCGCNKTPYTERDFFAMDTIMNLTLWGGGAEEAAQAVEQEIFSLQAQYGIHEQGSIPQRLNAGEDVALTDEQAAFLSETAALSRRTEGCLDPTICPVVLLWGFTTGAYQVPDGEQLALALEKRGMEKLLLSGGTARLAQGAMVDFGAVAKGYAGDRAVALLRDFGVERGIMSLGGNIMTFGEKPDGASWQIGVRSPFDDGYAGILSVSGSRAIVTSGGYQRYFEENGKRYHHIIDPATGAPAESGLASVTIVAESGLLADGLSTALFVMGLERAADFWRNSRDFEAVFITNDGAVFLTEGLEGSFSGECEVLRR